MTKTKQVRRPPKLRFSPTAWAKLLFLRDVGDTEVCGFGIAAANDLLCVEDLRLVKQVCTWVSAELDDESVAEFFDAQVDAGRRPAEFGRIFLHTHPGNSPQPSATDEETFGRVFGHTDWAVMFILARHGQTYARLRHNTGPGLDVELPVEVDFSQPFDATDWEAWHAEYVATVAMPPEPVKEPRPEKNPARSPGDDEGWLRERWFESGDRWADYEDFERELIDDYRY